MKTRIISLLVSLVSLLSFTLALAQSNISIRVTNTFDYPDPTSTIENIGKINDDGTSVGLVLTEVHPFTFVAKAFVRRANGTFTPPFIPLHGDGAQAFGINNEGVVCGGYSDAHHSHGFFLSGGSFTSYDAPGARATTIFGNNDNGDFVGGYTILTTGGFRPFLNQAGSFIPIDVISHTGSVATAINNLGEVVGSSDGHMFLRDPDGTVTYPIDAPGSPYLFPYAINDSGLIVGGANAAGFVWLYPDTFVLFDVPGSIYTEASGISNNGHVSGRYETSDGKLHGFIAQVIVH
jgi:uncharacterized membrane protein